jgi:hypothetical protein
MAEIKLIAAFIGIIGTLIPLIMAVSEYIKRGKKERAEFFLKLRDRFKGNEKFMAIQRLVEEDKNEDLQKLPTQDKNDLIGMFEEIYLLSGNGTISKQIIYYMFGQYALDCYQNKILQEQLNLDKAPYWQQFRNFCKDVEAWKNAGCIVDFKL